MRQVERQVYFKTFIIIRNHTYIEITVVKICSLRVLFIYFVLAFCSPIWASGAEKIRIAIVGDSTAASYPNPPSDRPDLTGWGQVFAEKFNEQVEVLNHAKSGRSSRSFMREGHWDKTLADKPDYVFVQFGHNDSSRKHNRFADPETTFQDFLRTYIQESRAIGAQPVIVSPVTRRVFKNGKIEVTLGPYAKAALKVAREENVPAVDLHNKSIELFNKLGDAGSAEFSPSKNDRTHFSSVGARAVAKLVADGVQEAVPGLKSYLITK